MPRICIEWVPVQIYGLGLFGFDHLQLVFQQDGTDLASRQDDWYVLEGVREPGEHGTYLGIEGADGRTTLSAANLAARENLVAKIGTPGYRGSRCLPYYGNELQAWETMASFARDIEQQDYPYVAYGLPGSPVPTINSSSAVASLMHYSGLDPSPRLPFGMHLSPGTATLLGTSGNDAMRTEHGFSTLLGGDGRDEFVGSFDTARIEKFYGGVDDDLFHWSGGFNIIHGGQPQLGYGADGTDVVDYSGAGTVTITFNRHWIPHKVPHFVAAFDGGLDHLFSVERIQWNAATDRIVLGQGVKLVQDDVILRPAAGMGSRSDRIDPAPTRSGRLIPDDDDAAFVTASADHILGAGERNLQLLGSARRGEGNGAANRLLGNDADNVLEGLAGDDTLYGGAGSDTLIGGAGSDGYVYLYGDGDDVIIDDGPDADVDVLILAGGIAPADVSVYRCAQAPDDLVLALSRGGAILIKDFFAAPASGIEQVLFDRAPQWTRQELLERAAPALLLDDGGLAFRPELIGSSAADSGPDLADPNADGLADAGGATLGEAPDPGAIAHPGVSPCAGLDLHEGWLF